ncbi:MAG: hypothetical protein P1V21_20155 [Rhizobiaceae bacterium]|nr:hypothetical protein [Rhizobiaceae bacterium]
MNGISDLDKLLGFVIAEFGIKTANEAFMAKKLRLSGITEGITSEGPKIGLILGQKNQQAHDCHNEKHQARRVAITTKYPDKGPVYFPHPNSLHFSGPADCPRIADNTELPAVGTSASAWFTVGFQKMVFLEPAAPSGR